MNTQQLLTKGYEILKNVDIESYIIDCQLLLSKVLKVDKLTIIMNRDMMVEEHKAKEFLELIELRKNKMPIKYILGNTEFMGMNFKVKPGVLIPRPDTEILVEEALRIIDENKFSKICDVCCGSGAIGVSMAKLNKNIDVECYDISDIACEVTRDNINALDVQHNVTVAQSDLLEEAIKNHRKFDLIVSNPPYIREEVIPTLMEDVKEFEPYIALSGGRDGLDFYRKITMESLKVLKKHGVIAYEIGYDQKDSVSKILDDNGFCDIKCMTDLAGHDRVVIGFLK